MRKFAAGRERKYNTSMGSLSALVSVIGPSILHFIAANAIVVLITLLWRSVLSKPDCLPLPPLLCLTLAVMVSHKLVLVYRTRRIVRGASSIEAGRSAATLASFMILHPKNASANLVLATLSTKYCVCLKGQISISEQTLECLL